MSYNDDYDEGRNHCEQAQRDLQLFGISLKE